MKKEIIDCQCEENHNHKHEKKDSHGHNHSLYGELLCHLPYAIFSVALGLGILSFFSYFSLMLSNKQIIQQGAATLFHSFHFMHIVFAATGTLITFFRFSRNPVKGILVGVISPAVFCSLSDAVLPYLGGKLLGVDMHFHMCFTSELSNVLPFLIVGVINGFIMGWIHPGSSNIYSIFSHAIHIIISSLASIFYLVAHGFTDWHLQIGFVFLYLIVAVVVPCTLSDVAIPMMLAQAGESHEKH